MIITSSSFLGGLIFLTTLFKNNFAFFLAFSAFFSVSTFALYPTLINLATSGPVSVITPVVFESTFE